MLVVVNSDPEVKGMIEEAYKTESRKPGLTIDSLKDLLFVSEENEIYDVINYELPDIVVINFSDENIPLDKILSEINKSRWLMSFGVIGLFKAPQDNEADIFSRFKKSNILAMIETYCISTHLRKMVEIIESNYQIIFSRELSDDMIYDIGGSFLIENDILTVSLYAGIASTMLLQRDLITPDTKMHVQMALEEIMVNAIEHGNCAISFDEKTAGMAAGKTVVDLVAEKCRDPAIASKRVELQWEIGKDSTNFIVTDQGAGFDVKAFLASHQKLDPFSQHGRGITMASKLMHGLRYNSKGNRVTMTVQHESTVEHEVPPGFDNGEKLNIKPGQIVLKEGDRGTMLYYIISGRYAVYNKNMLVAVLTPRDIFMGEMAFLMGQRRTATIIAETEGKLVQLSRAALVKAIKKYPQYGLFLCKLLARRLERSNNFKISRRNMSDTYGA
jgi:anti-sigma regulatory factor (Ser/Thr protein kinase)